MSWKTAFFSAVFFLSAVLPAISADKQIEDMSPKRTLTEEQSAQAKELLEKIKAEKARLVDVRKPLDDIEKEIKEPSDDLREIGKAAGAISTALNDISKQLDKAGVDAVKAKIDAEAKKMGGMGEKYGKLAMEAVEATSDTFDKDAKKKAAAQAKLKGVKEDLDKQMEKGTERLRKQISQLDPKRRGEEDKFREASKPLNVMRDQLRLLYGYDVQNATDLFTHGMENTGDSDMMTWIDEQGNFIARLSTFGYDDLADVYFDKIKKSPDPFTGKPMNDNSRNYLSKVGAKLSLQKAVNSKDLKEKLLLGQEAVNLYQEVVGRLLPQTPMYMEAVNELANAQFTVAGTLVDTVSAASAAGGSMPYPNKQYKTPEPPKKGSKDAKPAPAPAPGTMKYPADAVAKMDEKALAQASLEYANYLYGYGVEKTKPVQAQLAESYMDLIDNYLAAQDEKNKQKMAQALKYLNKLGVQKNKIQHTIEAGYAGWPYVFAPDSAQRKEVVAAANEFIEESLEDYRETWNSDKMLYGYWMLICASLPDPILEKGEDGKPVTHFEKVDEDEWKGMTADEKKIEMRSIARYPWASDRVENLFSWYIVGSDKEKGKAADNGFTQYGRVQGLLRYATAWTLMVQDMYRLADAQTDEAKKKELTDYAQKLGAKVEAALAEFGKPVTIVGPLDDNSRCKGLLEIGNTYYMYLAGRAGKANDLDKAGVYLQQALACAARARTIADGSYRKMASDALLAGNAFREKYNLSTGRDPEEWMPAMLISEAESAFSSGMNAEKSGNKAEAEEHFKRCRYYYLILVDKARKLTRKDMRDEVLPKALYNLGAAAVKVGDLDLAFIANQMLAVEFRNDFAEPGMNYDPKKYPNAAKYNPLALNNLRAAGYLMTKGNPKNPYAKRNYIDALMMNVRASGKGEDYISLINILANDMKDYESAVAFIDNVPEDNDYYRLTQLMASSIYLTMIQKASKEIASLEDQINPQPDEDGKVPAEKILPEEQKAKLKARQTELREDIKKYRGEADKYAKLFIKLHQEALDRWAKEVANGVKVPQAVQGIRNQEKVNLLQAMVIPLSLAFESGDYDTVLKMVPEYFTAVDGKKDISDADKLGYRLTAAWIGFNSQYRKSDYAKDDLAACVKNLEATQKLQEALAKADTENKYQSDAASLLGGAWLKLSSRAKAKNQEAEEKKYALTAVDWLSKAEIRIYEQVGTGINMGATLTEQKLYDRAENVLDKVIEFWGEGKFTEMSLYQSGQNAAGMKQMAPEVAPLLAAAFAADKNAAAAGTGDAALIKQLNSLLTSVKYEENAENIKKAFDAAIEANKGNSRFRQALEQGRSFLQGFAEPDKSVLPFLEKKELAHLKQMLKPSDDQRSRINRLMLEAAYPKTLYLQQEVPMISSPAVMLRQAQLMDRSYTSEAGRKKGAVLLAMISPALLSDSQRPVVYGEPSEKGKGGVCGQLEKAIEETKSDTEKQQLQLALQNLAMPLVVSVYGVPDRYGRLRDRSYPRARVNIAGILAYDKLFPTDESLPMDGYLKDLEKALSFEGMILYAKKNYAQAMVENGNYAKAEKYVQELCVLFPTDLTLQLSLGDIYTAMASMTGSNGKHERRPYSQESAGLYQQGFVQYVRVLNNTKSGSDMYWDAYLRIFNNEITSLEVRVKAAENLKDKLKITYNSFDLSTGKSKAAQTELPACALKGKALANDIFRLMNKADPKPSDEAVKQMQGYLERLAKIGYKPNELPAKEPDAGAPAAAPVTPGS